MEYIFTNLPRYITITPRSAFANSVVQANHVLLFSEDGETLTAKHPDGSYTVYGSGYGWDTSAPVTIAGQWLHVVAVFGQGSGGSRPASVYVNGVVTSGSFAYSSSAYNSYTPRLFLGSYWGNASYLPNFTGRMAAVRIYNRALTATEIAALTAEFTPTPSA